MSAFSWRHAVTTSNGVPSAWRPAVQVQAGEHHLVSPPGRARPHWVRGEVTEGHEAWKGTTMCKPGSACCGSGVTSTGLGLAVVALGAVGLVSMAAAVISSILTAVLVTLISIAAAGSIALAVHLYRTRGVVARPASRMPGCGRPPSARGRVGPARARPAVAPAVRAAIPARQPLAIEAPAPLHARLGVPAGSGGLAMARLAADWPGDMDRLPELLLPADIRPAPAAPAGDVVATR